MIVLILDSEWKLDIGYSMNNVTRSKIPKVEAQEQDNRPRLSSVDLSGGLHEVAGKRCHFSLKFIVLE